ncbi:MAG: tRNA (adenosine(37)-N6)-threonylcarbamoyltransferase complex dimerization subunit type 1 TsaB [Jatrophihabitantaceae bacterium]
MLVLVIDTSSAAVTAALVEVTGEGVELQAERVCVNARGHGEFLAPAIVACLAEAGAVPADLGAIVAGTGPGPYTGLRVGLVTAAVMGEALGIPTYGVCSLDAIAPSAQAGRELLVATDARRKEVYWARYDALGKRIDGPNVAKAVDVPTAGIADMAGAGARLYATEFGLNLLGIEYPSATAIAHCAAGRIRAGAPTEVLPPLYLRRPDAVAATSTKTVTQ